MRNATKCNSLKNYITWIVLTYWNSMSYFSKILPGIYCMIFLNSHPRIHFLKFVFGGIERNINMRQKHQSVTFHMYPNSESNPQLRDVPWLGIKFTNFRCMEWCSNQLIHLARDGLLYININSQTELCLELKKCIYVLWI